MKALIFNSGIGKRMGELTKNNHKSMVKLVNGETIFERQIRLLSECGITEFIVTTGLYEENFKAISNIYQNIKVRYVNNPLYDKTNYIYSFYLAEDYIDDDFLMLHGDLVFNKNLVKKIIDSKFSSCVTIDKTKPLPEKDFKGRLEGNKLREVSVKIFGDDCYTLQPFYKLSKEDITLWIANVIDFIENRHIDGVYAENAMNEISDKLNIQFFDASKDFVEEIDNIDDYKRVGDGIRYFDYAEQVVCRGIESIRSILAENRFAKPFVVIDSFLRDKVAIADTAVYFSDFKSNPLYEDVVNAVKLFKKEQCDCLISIGGGSAIDTAKAIKLFLPLDENIPYLAQEHVYIHLKHIAVPTTAGTGSESTRYAVVYYNGIKQSLTDDMLVPDYAVLETSFLETLPQRQKAATLFDALCQAIESLWSISSSIKSQAYAKEAIDIIFSNIDCYLGGDNSKNALIMRAANLAGKAINITQTTAAHAMSYKITSLFGIPHGQAVAMCMTPVWRLLLKEIDRTNHPLGIGYLYGVLDYLKEKFNAKNYVHTVDVFEKLTIKYGIAQKIESDKETFDILVESVNTTRLKNFPIQLRRADIIEIYKAVVSE